MDNINTFKETKLQQIHQYEAKSRKFRALGGRLRFVMIMGFVCLMICVFSAMILGSLALILILTFVYFCALIVLPEFRANAVKSAILLEQPATALRSALNSESDEEKLRRAILEIETKFITNDDELYAKKFVCKHYFAYISSVATAFAHRHVSSFFIDRKEIAKVFDLSPAAKMRLTVYVNGVISERPYKTVSREAESLLAEKNEQIDRYTRDFWKLHRKSLFFFFVEAVWLVWIVPFAVLYQFLLGEDLMLLARLVFFIGAAIVVYGEMMLITRQIMYLKGKKLMPLLISALIAIRHSMCESAGKEDAEKYRRYFKNAEKRFMLTTNEVESVKYVFENIKDKIETTRQSSGSAFYHRKKEKLQKYYDKFNYYRRQCMKYGCLEAFVALMIIPVSVFGVWLSLRLGREDMLDFAITLGYAGIVIVTEIILIVKHNRVWRYKEFYLLLFQELSATMSDPDITGDFEKLTEAFKKTERDAIIAAKQDDMHAAVEFISSVSGLHPDEIRPSEPAPVSDEIYSHSPELVNDEIRFQNAEPASTEKTESKISLWGYVCYRVDDDPRDNQAVDSKKNLYFFVFGEMSVSDTNLTFSLPHPVRRNNLHKKTEIKQISSFEWYSYDKNKDEDFGEKIRYLVPGFFGAWKEVGYFWLPGGSETEKECTIKYKDGLEIYFSFRGTPGNIRVINEIREYVFGANNR